MHKAQELSDSFIGLQALRHAFHNCIQVDIWRKTRQSEHTSNTTGIGSTRRKTVRQYSEAADGREACAAVLAKQFGAGGFFDLLAARIKSCRRYICPAVHRHFVPTA